MKKLCLIVGHEPKSPGAKSCSGESEFVFNSRLADAMVKELCHVEVIRVWRAPEGYGALPGKVNATGADLAVELHFNAANTLATGTETLCASGSFRGHQAALIMQRHLVAALGLRDRGVKGTAGSGRGGLFLTKTRMPALILEPFFGDNPVDWNRANARAGALATAIARAIEEILS